MKIIVFGGTGYIGSHVVEQLLLAGEQPLCPVRQPADTTFLHSLHADCRPSDFSDGALNDILAGADVVINCIARPQLHLSLAEQRKVDVELTVRLFRLAAAAGVRRFIQLSTVQVYGFTRPPTPVDEDYPLSGDYHYNQVAIEREEALRHIAAGCSTDLIMLRPCNTIGARDPNFTRIARLHRQGLFPLCGSGARFSGVDARDVGRAMVFLCSHATLHHDCYLLKGFDTSWPAVKAMLDDITGKTARAIPLPVRLMLLTGLFCEKLFPYGTNPPLIRFSVRVMSTDTLFDDARLRAEGFMPRYGLADALRAVL